MSHMHPFLVYLLPTDMSSLIENHRFVDGCTLSFEEEP